MPTCNIAEIVHNKWLQQSGNKMICLYETTMDDMIRTFMQFANYRTWLKGGSDGKGLDSASLKLKAAARCGDPKMLVDAMKSYPGAEDVNTRDCALEGSEFFGSTKRKLNLPPGVDCDSHRPDKVNYSIPRPNTRATRQRIEESLSYAIHSVAHTTSVLETDCLASKWHYCKITTQLSQTMLDTAGHYMDYVQCQSRDWETWHTCSNIQRAQEGISLSQQFGV
jgi:hypothetical protein